jgi:hypothetical protein
VRAREITLDLSGLARLFSTPRARPLRTAAHDRRPGLVRIAIAGTHTAARLLVRHRRDLIVSPGEEGARFSSHAAPLIVPPGRAGSLWAAWSM